MLSLRRMAAVFLALLVASWVVTTANGTGPAEEPATSPTGVEIEGKANDGTPVTGRFLQPTLPIASEYGQLELSVAKIRQIDFSQGEDNTVLAMVLTTDKTHLTGPLMTQAVQISSRDQPWPVTELRTLKFKHPKDLSLLAVALGLITLTLMEIVLGIDNIIFLAIVAGKLPVEQQPSARRIGLAAALGTRLLLLGSLSLLLKLTEPLFTLPALPLLDTLEARGISGRDLILLVGGLFLIGKSVKEVHDKVERAHEDEAGLPVKTARFWPIIAQIAVIDIIFSLDSVITAVGMVDELWVMITAMVLAVAVMVVFAEPISRFVERRPTVKILALSFLILIGVLLVAEGLGQHMNKGYIYFAMAFAMGVELVNMQFRHKVSVLPA